ncbi:MAG: mannose-1-phosphate guanylyltransferase [Lactobacillales bacterium]|jgi:mannose-1-phosphate guanylyltransferase|nr:mannose-1-phosphate guanylyltransferase [Lactobacillales bacterium]
MKIILLSGGSGKRLWPLSNNQRSKQFIQILKDENGCLESMVQRVWRQLGAIGLQDDVYIATGENQRSILKSQLGISDEKIISEPTRRDTFPAIALASVYLKSIVGIDEGEIIAVLPVDPYVEEDFFKTILQLKKILSEEKSTLGLIGIRPTYPSAKYGYILPEDSKGRKVVRFIEKPSEEEAKTWIQKGALWNAGVFGYRLQTILDVLREKELPIEYQQLVEKYDALPKNSFDYEFVEKQKNIAFLRYDGFWKDLGTWNTLTEEMGTQVVGKAQMIDSSNTHIINELELPVAVIDLQDVVVAAGSEGILVTSKKASTRVKEINNEYFESIRFIEEDWGVCHTLHEAGECCTTHYEMKDHQRLDFELGINQKLIRLSGEGTVAQNGQKYSVTGHDKFHFVVVTEG